MIDGGTFANIQIGEAVDRCRDQVFSDEDIILDVLLCGFKAYVDPWSALNQDEESTYKGSMDFLDRQYQLSRYYEMFEDLLRMTRGYPNI